MTITLVRRHRGSAGSARAKAVKAMEMNVVLERALTEAIGTSGAGVRQVAVAFPMRVEVVNVSRNEAPFQIHREDVLTIDGIRYVVVEDYSRTLAPRERRSLAIIVRRD